MEPNRLILGLLINAEIWAMLMLSILVLACIVKSKLIASKDVKQMSIPNDFGSYNCVRGTENPYKDIYINSKRCFAGNHASCC